MVVFVYEEGNIKQLVECNSVNFLPDRMVVMGNNTYLELDYEIHKVYLPEFDMEIDPEFIEEE